MVDSCNTPQRPPLSPSILNAISKKFRIALIIVSLNLTDTYIYHLNWFNSSNQCSKQLGYFSCFNSRMGYRLKLTTHYSLHAQSLEKLSCINLYHYPNGLLVHRWPPLFCFWVDSLNILSRVEFEQNLISPREDKHQQSHLCNRNTCTPTNFHECSHEFPKINLK